MVKKTCENCEGECCKYVAVEIDTPETLKDFEDIKWFVMHKNVNVFIDEDDVWHVEFLTPCEFLDKNGRCSIYEKRPQICRDYDQEECPFHNSYKEKHTFKSLEDIEKYIKKNFKDENKS